MNHAQSTGHNNLRLPSAYCASSLARSRCWEERMTQFWIVTCPEPDVRGGLWLKWFDERCLALGWHSHTYPSKGRTGDPGWSLARRLLERMSEGDRVVPFLKEWRIGPV